MKNLKVVVGPVVFKKQVGLGDVIAAIAQPIAGAIDAVAGTNIKECGGCKKRRAALNKVVSFSVDRQP